MPDVDHADDFSRYGTGSGGAANMLRDSVYASVGGTTTPSTTNPPPGRTHHIRSTPVTGGAAEALRVVLDADTPTFRVAARISAEALPGDNDSMYLLQMRDNANDPQFTVRLNSTGSLEVLRGAIDGVSVAVTDALEFPAGSYHYFEVAGRIGEASPAGGQLEIRVNGVVVLDLDSVDLQATAVPTVAQYVICRSQTTGGATFDYLDLSHGDTETFIGDTSWYWRAPDGDTVDTDWVRNTGSSDFECIDDTTPDDDTTYVEATTAAEVSIYDVEDLPASASEVVAVIAVSLVRKTDGGDAEFEQGVVSTEGSPIATQEGATHAPGQSYAYFKDVFAVDPATGVAWTPAGVNAAQLRIEKAL